MGAGVSHSYKHVHWISSGFHEGFNESLVKRFCQLIALDHSHQQNIQCQKGDRGEQCLYGQDIEISTTNHEQFHPSINKC